VTHSVCRLFRCFFNLGRDLTRGRKSSSQICLRGGDTILKLNKGTVIVIIGKLYITAEAMARFNSASNKVQILL
jgi:hypothetical protein